MRFNFFSGILTNAVIVIFVLTGLSQAQDKEEIWVGKLQAETSNRLLITIHTEKSKVKIGDSIPILINVKNNGKKVIYFVSKQTPEIINDKGDLLIEAPFPFPEDKEEYDYSFQRIEPNGNYKRLIMIPGSIIKREEDLRIKIGLGFVYDITGIDRQLKRGEDPMILRGPLGKRMEVVGLGDLRILVRPR